MTNPLPYTLYASPYELPLSAWIQAKEEGKLIAYCKEGTAPESVLVEHHGKMYMEYIDLSGGTELDYTIHLQLEVQFMQGKVIACETALNYLSLTYDSRLSDLLVEHALPFVGPSKDGRTGDPQHIAACNATLDPLRKMRLPEKMKELEAITADAKKNGAMGWPYYQSGLNAIAQWTKAPVMTPFNITLAAFVLMMKQMMADAKRMEEANRK